MNELRHMAEFEAALADYHVSASAQETLDATKLVLLTGVSAGGRNTVINELLTTGEYHFIISDTTRAPRENDGVLEQNGVEYWFRSEEDMLTDIKNGEFLEAEIIHGRQVSGISIRELKVASEAHKIAINDVDIGGIQNVLKLKPDTTALLLLPPSFEEWQRRLRGRGEMSDHEYLGRLQTALRIFTLAHNNDMLQVVINDDNQRAAQEIDDLAQGKVAHTSVDTETAMALIDSLRDKTRDTIERLS